TFGGALGPARGEELELLQPAEKLRGQERVLNHGSAWSIQSRRSSSVLHARVQPLGRFKNGARTPPSACGTPQPKRHADEGVRAPDLSPRVSAPCVLNPPPFRPEQCHEFTGLWTAVPYPAVKTVGRFRRSTYGPRIAPFPLPAWHGGG